LHDRREPDAEDKLLPPLIAAHRDRENAAMVSLARIRFASDVGFWKCQGSVERYVTC
jgi:hypothetical protein